MKRIRTYYEWKNPENSKNDHLIPIEYFSPENRYMTPWWERVFPSGYDLTEIDAERYILIVRNWGRRQYKELNKLKKQRKEDNQ